MSPEFKAEAEAHLKRTNDDIDKLDIATYPEGSDGHKYILILRQHRDMWTRFLGLRTL
jgi:hypothetical protein